MKRSTIGALLDALGARRPVASVADGAGAAEPRGRGYIEAVEAADDGLVVHGWLFSLDGASDAYRLEIDGRPLVEAPALPRADVGRVFAQWPQAARSGFILAGRAPAGRGHRWHIVAVIALRAGVEIGRIRLPYHPNYRDGLADPPTALRARVIRCDSLSAFWLGGLHVFGEFSSAIERQRRRRSVRRLLDWGCGCGRVTALFATHWPGTEVHGCDLDPEAISWCRDHLPGALFQHTAPTPPLPYEDGTFDVITAYSVLTHLDRRSQTAWLAELRRVLAPGGLLLATLHGDFALRFQGEAPVAQDIAEAGISDRLPDDALDGIAPPGFYRCVFQTREYSCRELSRGFDVLEYRPAVMINFQDLAVLRRARGDGPRT